MTHNTIPKSNKKWIDNATYEELLTRQRFAPLGDGMFLGDIGEYYSDVMKKHHSKISTADKVAISKRVGWGS